MSESMCLKLGIPVCGHALCDCVKFFHAKLQRCVEANKLLL